jgi:MoaA/NifB/PqqE/SkfB family radical SAM enzyme
MGKINLSQFGYSILQIETYSACNMKCQFCPYPIRLDKDSLLDASLITDLIDSINPFDTDFEYITLSQFNEPLMDERIFDFYRYLRHRNIPNLAITNGLLLNSSSIRSELVSSGPNKVKISLQTINKEKFGLQRGTSISPHQYFIGIAKYAASVDTNQTSIVLDLACNFLSRKKRLSNKLLGISNGDPSVEDSADTLLKDLSSFLAVMQQFDSRITTDDDLITDFLHRASNEYNESSLLLRDGVEIKLKPFFYGRRISDYHRYKGPIRCGNRILGVLGDGSVVPCCLAYDNSLALGNVKTQPLEDILHNNYLWISDLRNYTPLKSPVCQSCLGEPTRRGLSIKRVRTQLSELKSKFQSFSSN